MNFHPFIFNWKGQYQKTLETEKQLSKVFGRVTVINSDEENTHPHWDNVGDSYWFTNQFMRALNLFEGDVFFHVQADATYTDWEGLKAQAEEDFEKYRWGVYAPNVDFTEWGPRRTNLVYPKLPGNRSIVACPDCTCWMIHKDIIDEFQLMNLDMSDQNLGFGIDMLICSISHRQSRKVIRNYNHTVDHPRGTGYNVEQAHVELRSLWSKLPQHHKDTVNLIYSRPQQLGLFYVESG